MTAFFILALALVSPAHENLLINGDFEQGLAGWNDLWTRTPGGKLSLDGQERHGGAQSLRIEYTGREDWSLAQQRSLEVTPGQIYELSGWVRVQGRGDTTLCATLRDIDGRVTDWGFAGQTAGATEGWRLLRSRFIVPPGSKTLLPRLIGHGPATVWFDDASLVLQGNIDQMRRKDLPTTLRSNSQFLDVVLRTADSALSITDRRSGRRWTQWPRNPIVALDAKAVESGFHLTVLDPATMLRLEATIHLEPQRPEVALELSATGEIPHPVDFPQPLVTGKETFLVLPLNEGISYPAADQTVEPAYYYFYGGHGLCMAWYGETDGRQGVMTIVETPDDAGVRMVRHDGLLSLSPEWEPQKGQFAYARRLRWVFFDDGGYVAMCKRYRQHARRTGLLKTLAEKRTENPNVDLLVGAVNVWCWDKDAVGICRELQAAGIRRILWSNGADPETLRRLNAMGVLTSRYDIYQDVMDPANFPKLRGIHSDWTTGGWPNDLMLDAQGQWLHGWEVEGKDGQRFPCGVLCDRQAPDYARRRISDELKTHPYRCRFLDTTTASPWRECYDAAHPLTRSESRYWKMDLLKYVSEGCHLVTGSETGHEAAVPYAHYFEGMLSLGPYRVPDAGRNVQRVLDKVPESVAKFQTGHFYRLPLWELVYHDCLVAQWYWGDYSNKLPELWDRRDLINALYGTPPMFMFTGKLWQQRQERFVRSYRTAAPCARATGYAEMLSHRWLTADHSVQETRFAGGVAVTVNFGERPYKLTDGTELPPLGHRVTGLKDE
ncbi:MAG: glycoside hydrolase [Thermoguttaceae bacterium]